MNFAFIFCLMESKKVKEMRTKMSATSTCDIKNQYVAKTNLKDFLQFDTSLVKPGGMFGNNLTLCTVYYYLLFNQIESPAEDQVILSIQFICTQISKVLKKK